MGSSIFMGCGADISSPGRWRLLRLDDNGNEFEVAVFDDPAQAHAARLAYELKGHKQLYFVVARPAACVNRHRSTDAD